MSGVPVKDIYHVHLDAGHFKPKWYLFFDTASKSIVVSIRGTFNTADVATDLTATQDEYRGHTLHHGILASAEFVYHELLEKIPSLPQFDQLRQRDMYFVVTGHSLGGSVASIVAWMLRTRDEESGMGPFDALAFAFGAPPIGDQGLTQYMESFVINVIHHKDMMPSISVATFKNVKDRVLEEVHPLAWQMRHLEETLSDFNLPSDPDELRKVLERCTSAGRLDDLDFHEAAEEAYMLPTITMYNPGWQIALHRQWDGCCPCLEWFHQILFSKCSLNRFMLLAHTPAPEHLHTFHFSTTMWFDHFPFAYQYVCETYAERVCSDCQHGVMLPEALTKVARYLQSAGPTGEQ